MLTTCDPTLIILCLFIFHCDCTQIFLRQFPLRLKYLLIILFVLQVFAVVGQDTSSNSPSPQQPPQGESIDTALAQLDTLAKDTIVPAGIDSLYLKLLDNPYLRMTEPPVYLVISERVREDKDDMFYLFAGLMMLLAFIKLVFPRYFANVFQLFFQPSFRQKQTREQLLQSALPSLLLNIFFILSGGAYLALLVDYYKLVDYSFWLLFLDSTLFLLILYTIKYLFITFAGWVFNVKQAAETYIFVVYLINKIIGVLLLPSTLLIAFSEPSVIDVTITISLLLVGLLLLYRYVVSFSPVRREVKVSLLHFFFYILAFEVTPLLVIYKTLVNYLDKSL